MRLRDHCHPRVQLLLDLLCSALSELQESRPGFAGGLIRRMLNYEPCTDPEDRLIRLVGTELKADQATALGKHDEALLLLQQAADMRDDDDDARYIDLAGMVRIHFDRGDQLAGFELLAKWALTAVRNEALPSWVAFDMLILAQFGDLAVSLQVPAFLDALTAYESRFLPDKGLSLAESWRDDPTRALETLLPHNPHTTSRFGFDSDQEPNILDSD